MRRSRWRPPRRCLGKPRCARGAARPPDRGWPLRVALLDGDGPARVLRGAIEIARLVEELGEIGRSEILREQHPHLAADAHHRELVLDGAGHVLLRHEEGAPVVERSDEVELIAALAAEGERALRRLRRFPGAAEAGQQVLERDQRDDQRLVGGVAHFFGEAGGVLQRAAGLRVLLGARERAPLAEEEPRLQRPGRGIAGQRRRLRHQRARAREVRHPVQGGGGVERDPRLPPRGRRRPGQGARLCHVGEGVLVPAHAVTHVSPPAQREKPPVPVFPVEQRKRAAVAALGLEIGVAVARFLREPQVEGGRFLAQPASAAWRASSGKRRESGNARVPR